MTVTRLGPPWRAVAHPARRRLIDLLREGPRTTGDLARAFSVSRFAVMKHLAVLEASGVVTVVRRGRERWNALDPGPLARLDAYWSGSAPGPIPPAADATVPVPAVRLPTPAMPSSGLLAFRVTRHVFIDAAPSRVFDALTLNLSAWWGPPHVRSPEATTIVLEPHLGGRFYEEWGHRQGWVRGLVTAIRQDQRLEISGAIFAPSPWPAVAEIALDPREGGTLVALTHTGFADADRRASMSASCQAAWDDLLAVRLKAFVEGGTRTGLD